MRSFRLPSRTIGAVLSLLATLAVARCADEPLRPTQDARIQAASVSGDPTVSSVNPTQAPQDTTLEVAVHGSNFKRGSAVALGLAGTPSSQIVTNSTRYVNQRELRANITITADAAVASYDVIVTTSDGRKGIGTEMFAVKKNLQLATLTILPTLGSNSEALAVNEAGTVAVGHSFDRDGYLYAVKWVLQGGSWVISTLPYTGSVRAMGVNNADDVVGYFASSPRHAVFWPAAGGSIVLDCATDLGTTQASAISAAAPRAAGTAGMTAAVWSPGSCRENLPPLFDGGSSSAYAINGDGTIVGGSATPNSVDSNLRVPVRWTQVGGAWQIEQLDSRPGRVSGSNALGDLVGSVKVPCALAEGCDIAIVWYLAGGSRELGSLGGDHLWATDINSAGEVVGRGSPRTSSGGGLAFFWSESIGLIELPNKALGAGAWAVSEVRADGTRLVAGTSGTTPYVWVVRNP